MGQTIYGDIPEEAGVNLSATFLEVGQPYMMVLNFAQHDVIPKNKSQRMKWRRYEPLPATPKVLQEGVTPKPGKLKTTDVYADLEEYGDLLTFSNRVTETHEDPVLDQFTTRLGESSGEMLENVAIAHFLAGTNAFHANGDTRAEVNTKVSKALLRKAIKALKVNRARFHTRMLKSTNGYGTVAIPPSYVGICHPAVTPDLQDIPGFKRVEDYGQTQAWDHEIGAFENVRFLEEDLMLPWEDMGGVVSAGLASTSGVKCDVYPILIFGKDAFGAVALKGYKSQVADSKGERILPVELKVIQPDRIDKSDPLGQRGFVGYRTWFACEILQDLWMTRLEVAATE
uniref:N4-gp56 family major capsid protein n=1 Tax=Desulfovibrio sp. U5L TaxID=596152 RepID=I2Q1E2_9BACT